jgi:hypothetical protein
VFVAGKGGQFAGHHHVREKHGIYGPSIHIYTIANYEFTISLLAGNDDVWHRKSLNIIGDLVRFLWILWHVT